MAIMSDFEGVFEVEPMFRAKGNNMHRFLCEFTGLDLEMQIKFHYFEILDLLGELFKYIFSGIQDK